MLKAYLITLAGIFLFTACGGGSGVTEQQVTDKGDTTLPPMPELPAATLGPSDVFEVRVYQEKELSGTYRVGSDGTFDFPLIGQVKADGETPSSLAKVITERLSTQYLRDPQVSVFVKEFNSKKVFVLGEVNKPGTFPFEDDMTIVQAITLAGGFKNLADKDKTVVTRRRGEREKKFVVPVEKIGKGQAQNIELKPGDIIFVPQTWL
ncbi:MAG: polysaccharide biosynthesis/export family protein [Bradymonadia bacterium]